MKHNWFLLLAAVLIAVTGVCAGASASALLSENLGSAAYSCSGSYLGASGSWGAAEAFDGIVDDAALNYFYAWGAWAWVEVDLGATMELTQLDGWTIQADTRRTQIYVSDSPIQSAAGPSTLVADFTGPTIFGKSFSYSFEPGTRGRYVQVNAANSNLWLDWTEIQIYGSPVPEPTCLISLLTGCFATIGFLRRRS